MVSTNDEKLIKNQKISEILSGLLVAKSKANTAETLQAKPKFIRDFFDEPYFRWDESLIDKLLETNSDLEVDSLLEESIDLGKIYDNNLELWNFAERLKWCNSDFIHSLAQNIYKKVEESLKFSTWWGAPNILPDCYKDSGWNFSLKPVPASVSATQCVWYIQDIIDYLTDKEGKTHAKKASEVFWNLTISNDDINNELSSKVASWTYVRNLSDDIKKSFDVLLKYEIWRNVDAFIDYSEKATKQVANLFSNALPGINTLITKSWYKYDEAAFQACEKDNIKAIMDDKNATAREKENQMAVLRRIYYIADIKSKNLTLWNTLEKLYENDFDYSELEDAELQAYLNEITKINLDSMIKNDFLRSAFHINFGDDLDDFEDFYRKLGDITEDEITLDKSLGITLPVEKRIIPWKHSRLNNLRDAFGDNPKPWDSLPIEYKIKKEEIEKLKIWVEDMTNLLGFLSQVQSVENENEYIFEWENVGKLIFLFFLINSKHPLSEISPEQQKKVDEIFWKKNDNTEWHSNEEERTTNSLKDPTDTPENFKSEIEKFWIVGDFKDWSEIWIPFSDSTLPWWWKAWFKIKISDVNMEKWTFKWTSFWWELWCKKNEWLFDMNKATLERFQTWAKDKILLLKDPDNSDFSSYKTSLNGKLWNENIFFPPEWVKRDWNKFTHKVKDEKWNEKEEEVKNFWINDWDNLCTYKIKYQPWKKTFLVSWNFDWKWQDEKDKDKLFHYSYKREMDWNNFLIFMNEKKLKPQNKKEIEAVTQKQNEKTAKEFKIVNGKKLKLNRFSINSFKTAFKDITKNIKGQLDAYNKAQADKLEDILVDDWWLYEKLWDILWFIPSMKEAFGNLEEQYYLERDNRAWKKIEFYLKKFQSDPDFATTFEELPPQAKLLYWKSLKWIVESRLNNNPKLQQWEELYQTAALLLANIEKWWWPYRWLKWKDNSGVWVKALLWEDHYNLFMKDKEKLISILKTNPKNKDQLQDKLARCEMEYIVNNVQWANGGFDMWSNEERGLPDWTDESWKDLFKCKYIDNPAKRILSNQFADKLNSAYKWWISKSSIDSSKIESNDFNVVENDFRRFLKSWRIMKSLNNLEKLFTLAKDEKWPHHETRFKKAFALLMLSGVMDVYGTKDLRKKVYQWSKTCGFIPWMVAKDTWHSEIVAELLDKASDGSFSRNVSWVFKYSDLLNGDLKIDQLQKDLDKRRTPEMNIQIDKYLKNDFTTADFSDNPKLKWLQSKLFDTSLENISDSLTSSPFFVNSGWLLSSSNVVEDRARIQDWEFYGKDSEDKDNRVQFWKKITDEVYSLQDKANDKKTVNFVLNQYLSRFWMDSIADRQEVYKRINTAERAKQQINAWHSDVKYTDPDPNIPPQYAQFSMWKIAINPEVDSIIWFSFLWRVLHNRFRSQRIPNELNGALLAFQKFFKTAFDEWTLTDNYVISKAFKADDIKDESYRYPLWSWDTYKEVFGKSDSMFGEQSVDLDDVNNEPNKLKKWKKQRIKRIFETWWFINKEIADIKKSLKNYKWDIPHVIDESSDEVVRRIQML